MRGYMPASKKSVPLVLIAMIVSLSLSCNKSNPVPPPGFQPIYPQIDAYPAWSPDGRSIIYNHGGITEIDQEGAYQTNPDSAGFWLINSDGSNPHLVMKGEQENACWSPDGRWIAFETGAQIYKAPINESGVDTSRIVQLTFAGRNFFPAWSPDSQWIAYDRSLADGTGPAGIWIVKNDGTMRGALFGGAYPAWHPSGRIIIAVIGTSPTSSLTRFVLFDLNQSKIVGAVSTGVSSDNSHPQYSSDGTKIVFESNFDIWLMNSDGTNLTRLVTNGGVQPSWAPEGKRIAYINYDYQKYDTENNGTLWVMDSDGSNKHQLTHGPEKN